jgi:hypothetical protein
MYCNCYSDTRGVTHLLGPMTDLSIGPIDVTQFRSVRGFFVGISLRSPAAAVIVAPASATTATASPLPLKP